MTSRPSGWTLVRDHYDRTHENSDSTSWIRDHKLDSRIRVHKTDWTCDRRRSLQASAPSELLAYIGHSTGRTPALARRKADGSPERSGSYWFRAHRQPGLARRTRESARAPQSARPRPDRQKRPITESRWHEFTGWPFAKSREKTITFSQHFADQSSYS